MLRYRLRPLTELEMRAVLAKIANYAGPSLKNLFAPLDQTLKPDRHVLRLSHGRVYFVLLSIAESAISVARKQLLSCEICIVTLSPLSLLSDHYLGFRRPLHQDW